MIVLSAKIANTLAAQVHRENEEATCRIVPVDSSTEVRVGQVV